LRLRKQFGWPPAFHCGAYGLAVNELNNFRITTSAGTLSLAGASRHSNRHAQNTPAKAF